MTTLTNTNGAPDQGAPFNDHEQQTSAVEHDGNIFDDDEVRALAVRHTRDTFDRELDEDQCVRALVEDVTRLGSKGAARVAKDITLLGKKGAEHVRDTLAAGGAYASGWAEGYSARDAETRVVTKLAALAQAQDDDVRAALLTMGKDDDKRVRTCGTNIDLILRASSEFYDRDEERSFLRWNVITRSIEVTGGDFTADAERGALDVAIKNWLESTWNIFASREEVGAQLLRVAQLHGSYDPVGAYLSGLTWDGKPRIDRWLETYAGVGDSSYIRKIGARWLISGAARGLDPGCKVDTVLILQGPQGFRKSTCFDVLGGEWFSDSPLDLTNKDSRISASCTWIVELPELAALGQSGLEKQKAFLAARVDRVRPPYGRADVSFKRHCIFAGTTNADEFLIDSTGNRRYWVATVTRPINVEALRRDRDQLWAEAVARYRQGESWWFDHDEQIEADEVTERHRAGDSWADVILTWWNKLTNDTRAKHEADGLALADVARLVLDVKTENLKQKQKEIGAALRAAGFDKREMTKDRLHRWFRAG